MAAFFLTKTQGPKNKGSYFTVGRDPLWYPVNFVGKQKQMQAFTNELLRTIGNLEGVDVEIVNAPHTNALRSLDNNDFDALVSSIQPTLSLKRRYIFSDLFFLTGPVLLVPDESPITGLQDTSGKVIGVSRSSSLVFDITKNPSAVYISYDDPLEAMDQLSDGEIDGVIVSRVIANKYNEDLFSNQFRATTAPLTQDGFRLVARNTLRGEKIITAFNRGLLKLVQDGKYDKLIARWGFTLPLSKSLQEKLEKRKISLHMIPLTNPSTTQ